MDLRQITVIGSGTMGRGIAQVAALAGYDTILHDVEDSMLSSALDAIRNSLEKAVEKGKLTTTELQSALARIQPATDLESAAREANLIIEAVPEDFDLKRDVLSQVDLYCGSDTILASNTSSLSITQLASSVERRDRFIGMHFFNPVPIMKLVEIVVGERTSNDTTAEIQKVIARMKKEAIIVKDTPGFATSRLGLAIGLEAIRMLEDGVATAADIDRAMELGYNHPMGPLRLTDLIGLDVRLNIATYLASTLGARFDPPQLLRSLVEQGRLGRKSGRGFYEWQE